jgi:general stress protein YciG
VNDEMRTTNPAVAAEGDQPVRRKERRGFASMSPEKQREIASKGGRAAHQKGTAHEFDSSEARAAGRKGGVTVSRNREHMAAIGRRGGEARGANRAARLQQGTESRPSSAGNGQASTQRFQGDREVGVGSNGSSTNAGAPGTARQSGNSLGGERNTGSVSPERNVERP